MLSYLIYFTGKLPNYCLYLRFMRKLSLFFIQALLVLALCPFNSNAEKLENIHNLVERLSSSVVRIETTSIKKQNLGLTGDPFLDEFFDRHFGENFNREFNNESQPKYAKGLGSGFVYSEDGLIVTNYHVIKEASDISIVLSNDNKYKAEIVGVDERTDLALLKIKPKQILKKATLGNSDSLRIGEWVLAIGNPLGFGTTVTTGIVSAKGRYIDDLGGYVDFIQTDAALNKGNSGGPLFNLDGQVIGVNTAISATGQGIGFAIPSNMASNVISQLKNSGIVERGWLGIVIQKINKEIADSLKLKSTFGGLVSDVIVDGPAFKAGVKRGDIIISIGSKQIKEYSDLPREVGRLKPNTKVKLGIIRNNKSIEILVLLGQIPTNKFSRNNKEISSKARDKFGFDITEFVEGPNSNNRKILVTRTYPNTNAESILTKGDIILEINRKSISNIESFNSAINKIKPNENCLFLIQRKSRDGSITFYKSIKSMK